MQNRKCGKVCLTLIDQLLHFFIFVTHALLKLPFPLNWGSELARGVILNLLHCCGRAVNALVGGDIKNVTERDRNQNEYCEYCPRSFRIYSEKNPPRHNFRLAEFTQS